MEPSNLTGQKQKATGPKLSGVQKPKSGGKKGKKGKKRLTNAEKADLKRRRVEESKIADAHQTELQGLEADIEATRSRLAAEKSDETKAEIQEGLNQKVSRQAELKTFLQSSQKTVEEIDDAMDIDESEAEEDQIEPEPSHSPQNEATEPSQSPQNEATEPQASQSTHVGVAVTQPIQSARIDMNEPHTSIETDYEPSGRSERDNGLTNIPHNVEDDRQPRTSDDFPNIDEESKDDDDPSQLFEIGTVVLKKTARGDSEKYLNSYGPLNSAMTIWCSNQAPKEIENCPYLKGDDHKTVMATNHKSQYLYKRRIKSIKRVAWDPRGKATSMLDLCNSVEQLNPENKRRGKYVYPPTTILVDWHQEPKSGVQLPTLWIDRSDYRTLTPSPKADSGRADEKIYQLALRQVRNYRNWVGTKLDKTWNGERREGKEQSATPWLETPGPEEQHLNQGQNSESQISQANNGQAQNGQAQNSEAQNNEAQNNEAQNNEAQIGQAQNGQAQNNEAQNNEAQNNEAQNNEAQNGQAQNSKAQNSEAQHSSSHATLNHANEKNLQQESSSEQVNQTENISDFYEIFMEKMDLDPDTPWKSMNPATFGEFVAAAKSYIRRSKEQNIDVQDDMNFGRSFRKWI